MKVPRQLIQVFSINHGVPMIESLIKTVHLVDIVICSIDDNFNFF